MRKTVTRGTVQRVTRLQSSAMGNPRYAFTVSVPCGADGESQDSRRDFAGVTHIRHGRDQWIGWDGVMGVVLVYRAL